MKDYPALDVATDSPDLLLALVDDFSPTAVEERGDVVRVFFTTTDVRDAALAALTPTHRASAVDVSDEDWARRSQENLKPVTVGRITVLPSPPSSPSPIPYPLSPIPDSITITILPSMGFGTGHHATTRLCLRALQDLGVAGKTMIDVGTGSGVLAIAADRLGASSALGLDVDTDAVQAARENLDLNPDVRHVRLEVADLSAAPFGRADIVTANLTGALLVRSAARLGSAVNPGGILIVSGLQTHERDEIVSSLCGSVVWEAEEDGWVGLAMKLP